MRGHVLQAREILNDQFIPSSANQVLFFESAENSACGFFRQTGHVGQILVGEPDANADAVRLLNAGSLR